MTQSNKFAGPTQFLSVMTKDQGLIWRLIICHCELLVVWDKEVFFPLHTWQAVIMVSKNSWSVARQPPTGMALGGSDIWPIWKGQL